MGQILRFGTEMTLIVLDFFRPEIVPICGVRSLPKISQNLWVFNLFQLFNS
jgi:hypothetical protein